MIFLLLINLSVYSATRTSTAVGGNWNVGGSWVGGIVPAVGDDAVLVGPITVSAFASVTNVTVNAGGSLTLNSTFIVFNNLTVNSNTTFSGVSPIIVVNSLIIAGGTLTANNPITTNTLTINAGTILSTGGSDFTVNAASTITGQWRDNNNAGTNTFTGLVTIDATGTFSTANNSPFVFGGGISNNGTFSQTGTGAITLNANQTINNSGVATMIISGAVSDNASALTISGNQAILFAGSLSIANNCTLTNQNTSTVTINGVLDGGSANSTWINSTNSTLVYNNMSQPMNNGALIASANPNTVTYNLSGPQGVKSTTYHNLNLFNSNTKTPSGNIVINNNLNIAAGVTCQIGSQSMTNNGTSTISGTFDDNSNGGNNTFAGLVTVNAGGTISTAFNSGFTFGGGINNFGTFSQTGVGSVTFNNSQTVNSSGTSTMMISGITTINGVNTIFSGNRAMSFLSNVGIGANVVVRNQNTSTVSITGTLDGSNASSSWINDVNSTFYYGNAAKPFNTSGYLDASATPNTVNYTLVGAQTVFPCTYYNLTTSGGNIKTLAGNITILNDLSVNGGSLDVSALNYNISIAGDWTNTGSFVARTGLVTFNGSNQVITNAAGETFYRLTISSSGTITFASGNVAATNTLTMTSGNINTGSNKLTLGTSTANIGTFTYTTGTIIGKFERWLNATGVAYIFPVGTATNNNRFTITFAAGLTSGSLITQFISGDPGSTGLPLADNSRQVNPQYTDGYWNIVAQNALVCTNYNVTLNATGFASYLIDAETRVIKRTNGGSWSMDGTHVAAVSPDCYRNAMTSISSLGTQLALARSLCVIPAITTQPNNSTICAGSNTTFTVTATGTSVTYQWQENQGAGWNNLANGGVYSNVTTATLNLTSVGAGMTSYQYRCYMTDPCMQPLTTNTVTLTVNIPPSITTQPSSSAICAGSNTSFSVTAAGTGLTYQWQLSTDGGTTFANQASGGVYSNMTTPIMTITGATIGMNAYQYRCLVSGICSPLTSNSATLTINSVPSITVQPINKTTCEGTSVSFTVTATGSGLTYQWRKGGVDIAGATSSIYTIASPVPGDAGNYDVVVTGTCSPSVTSNVVTLTVNALPVVTVQPVNSTICVGANTTFAVTATGTSLTYQWQLSIDGGVTFANQGNGGFYSNMTTATMSITGASVGMNGYRYRCLVGGTCAPSSTSNAAILTMNALPAITVQPINKTTCEGTSVSFSLTATGAGLTYQWRKGGVNIAGATSSIYTIASPVLADAGSYDVVVSGTCAPPVTSSVVTLTVNALPAITVQPTSQSTCAGTSVSFSVTATGIGLTYQWRKGGVNIGGATSAIYTIAAPVAGDAGNYDVVVSGTCAPAATSNLVTLTVSSLPAITVQPTNQTTCVGTSVSFSVTATGTGLTYQWRKSGVNIAGATSSMYVIASPAAGDAGSYDVVVSGTCTPPVTSNVATLIVNALPSISVQPTNQTTCAGTSVSFSVTATGVGLTYQWRKGGVNIGGATLAIYTIVAPAAGDAGNYDVVVSGTCAPSVTSNVVSLTVYTLPAITIQPTNQTTCVGTSVSFSVTATGTGLAYQWRKSGANIAGATSSTYTIVSPVSGDAGSYDVVVSGTCTPSVTSNVVTLTVNTAPNVTVQPVSSTICAGANTSFSITATGTALTYQWQLSTDGGVIFANQANGGFYSGMTTTTMSITTATGALNTYQYRCAVSGTCTPAATSNAAVLTVNALPTITVQPANQASCAGSNVTFSVTATGTGLTYQWRKGGVNIAGATSSNYTIISPVAGDAGSYDVVISGTCTPSVTSNVVTLTINTSPVITVQPVTQSTCVGSSVTFSVTATGASLTYQWRKGGVNIAGAIAATYTIAAPVVGDAGNYDVVIGGSCAPATTSNIATLTVNTLPTVTVHPVNSTICAGANTTFAVTATGTALTYQWQLSTDAGTTWNNQANGGVYSNMTTATMSITAAITGMNAYRYRCSVSGTCVPSAASNGAILTVNSLPSITTQPTNQTTCVGGSVSFSVTAAGTGLTYQWRKGGVNIGGATSATYTIASPAVGDAGNYDVVVSGTCAPSVTSNLVSLTVNTLPAITVQPTNQTVCAGASITFSVTATGTSLAYQWRKSGVNIAGATSSTYIIPVTVVSDAGSYDVVVSGACTPAVTSNAVSLTVNGLPAITVQPANQITCVGTSVSLTVTATGAGLTYQWRKGGVNVAGATTATYTIAAPVVGDAGNYDVVISGTCPPSVTSNLASLTVNTLPAITVQPANQTVCAGSGASFSVTATGTGLTYQWRKSGTNIAGATSAIYTIPVTAVSDAGSYDVVVSGSCTPAITSGAVTLTINSSPVVTVQPSGSVICVGSNTTFSVTATGAGLTYQWQLSTNGGTVWANQGNGGVYSNMTTATMNITTATAGMNTYQYRCVVSGTCTPTATSNAAVLTVNTLPAITVQPANQTTCEGTSVSFSVTATGTGVAYQWRKGGINIAGATSAMYTIASPAVSDAGSYDVMVSGTCTPAVTSNLVTLTVNSLPAITTQPTNQTTCVGSSISFSVTASGTTLTYQWRKGGVNIAGATSSTYIIASPVAGDAGNYDVVISGICAPPVTSNLVSLTVNTLPAITVQPTNKTTCAGTSVSFSVTATGTNPAYQWRKSGVNIAGATAAIYSIASPVAGDAGSYDVVVSGACTPSVTSNLVTLTVNALPAITVQPANQTTCVGTSVSFSVTATGTGLTYQWRKGGVNIAGATSAIYTIAAPVAGDAGNYDVVVGGTCAPAVTSSVVTLTVNTLPAITVQPTNQTTCAGTSASFSVTATGTNLTYQWRKGGLDIAGATSATYTIPSPVSADAGSYNVVVSGACTPSATSNVVTLTVNAAPTVISQPNNSIICVGANTTFAISATGTALTYQWQLSTDGGTTFNNQANGGVYSNMTTATMSITGAIAGMNTYQYRCAVSGTCTPAVTSNAVTLTVNSLPAITVQPTNQTGCEFSGITFSVTATGTSLAYQWRKGGVNIAGATSPTYTIPSLLSADAGSYDVVVSGACTPSVTSNTVNLTVNTAPALSASPANSTICVGANTVFSVTASGTSVTYQWQLSTDGGTTWNNQANGGVYSNMTTAAMGITGAVIGMNAYKYRCAVSGTCTPAAISNSATLTVNALPAITVQPTNQTTCIGSSVSFSVTATGAGLIYQWRKGGIAIGGANSSIYTIASPVAGDAGNYDVVVSGTCAPAVTSNMVTLTINALPAITVQPTNKTTCEGSSVSFSVTATGVGLTYQWRKAGVNIAGATAAIYTIAAPVVGDAGNYDVVVTSGTCTPPVTSNLVSLTVYALPVITVQPASQGTCSGTSVTFSVTATGTGLAYQWRKSGVDLFGATSSAYTIVSPAAGDAGNYDVVVSGTCTPSVTSNIATLTVDGLPAITVQPTNQTTCAGSSVSFSITATGPSLNYQWRKGGVNIAGATSATYTIPVPVAGDAGNYDVVVSSPCAPSVTSNLVTLTIYALPVITIQPTNQTTCAGTNVSFSVTATGTSIVYQWRKSGVNIAGATSSTYTIISPVAGDAGNYDVVVSGSCAPSVISNLVTLTVNTPPTITVQPVSQSTCAGVSMTFSVTATGAGLTYQWRKGGVNIAGATLATYTIASPVAGDAGSYDVVITGTCAPSATSGAAILTINTAPVVTVNPANSTICAGANTTFSVTATGTGLTYQWQLSTDGGTVWNNQSTGGVYTNMTTATMSITAATNGMNAYQYRCVVSGTCAPPATSNAAVLTINPLPSITVQPTSQTTCVGTSVSLSVTATGAGLSYQWRKGGVNIAGATSATYTIAIPVVGDAGNYDVVVSGTCTPSVTSNIVTITVNTLPTITVQPTNKTTCAGNSMSFSVTATGSNLTYQWRKSGADIAGATSSTYTIASPSTADAGNYDVVVSGTCTPAVISNAVSLTVNEIPSITVQPTNQTTCVGSNVSFSVTAAGVGLAYQWRKGGVNIAGATSAIYTIASPVVGDAGNYDVVISGTCTPSVTSSLVSLTVNTLPAITVQPTNQTTCAGTSVSFSVTATGTGLNYQWRKSGAIIAGATTSTYTIASPVTGDAGNYDVLVGGSCTPAVSSNVVTLSINSSPTVIVQPVGSTICAGGNTSFAVTATGTSLTYQWQLSTNGGTIWNNQANGGVYSNMTTSTMGITGATAGMNAYQYRCVVSGTCTPPATSNVAILTVNTLPVITVQPVNQTTCIGSSVSFSVTATGTNLTYQWRKGGLDIAGATSAIYTIASPVAGDAGSYDVVVSGACTPAATSNAVTLAVNFLPAITVQPTNQTTCAGTSVSFSVTATGTALTYQWRKGGVNIGGATSAIYTIASPVAGDAGNYDVLVSGSCTPAVTSNVVSLTVNSLPIITAQPTNQPTCEGTSVSFSVTATGTNLAYQWRKSGVDITGATSAIYTIASPVVTDAGSYDVVISGICTPSVTSNVVTLTVNTLPAITVLPVNQVTCAGTSVSFSLTATGTGLTYQWRKAGVNIVGATSAIYTIASPVAGDAGNYDVVVSGTCAPPVISNIVTLTVNALPTITVQPTNQVTCAGTSVSFSVTATGTGLSYQWRKSGVNIAGATAAIYTIASPVAGDAGSFDVIISGTCTPPVISNIVTLTVNALPAITVQPVSQTTCAGTSVSFSMTAVGTNPTYQWRKGGVNIAGATAAVYTIPSPVAGDAGNYDVVVSGSCAPPVTSNIVTLTINTLPAITAQPTNQITCEGTSVSFNITATGTGLTYQWRKSGVNIPGATAAIYTIASPVVADAGSYDVVVAGTCTPSVMSNVVTLTVNSLPAIIVQPTNQITCAGASVSFNVTATGTGLTYQWRKGGVDIFGATSAIYTIPAPAAGDAGNYDVVVNGTCASSVTSNVVTLTINTLPTITVQPTNQTTCEGTSVSFNVTATGAGLTYQWRKGGVNIAGATAATYTIPLPLMSDVGSYDVVVNGSCTPAVTSNVVTLTVNTAPAITVTPVNSMICEGSNTNFSVTATGTALTYQWQLSTDGGTTFNNQADGGVYGGMITNTMSITGATAVMNSYLYKCVVSGTCAPPASSNVAVLTVNTLPVITVQPTNQTACEFSNVSLTVTATGTGLTYQWRKGGVNIAGATSAIYTIASLVAGDAGSYDVVVAGTCTPAVTSNSVTITVNKAPAITSQPANAIICIGSNATFSVTATGSTLAYQWQLSTDGGAIFNNQANGGVYSGMNTATMTITGSIIGMNTYQYRCLVSGACVPTTTTDAAILTVNTLPAITVQPSNQITCAGISVSFSVTATGTGLSYQWRKGGTTIPGANVAIYTIPSPVSGDAGSYDVVVSGACSPAATSNAVTLTVNTSPAITVQPTNQTTCAGTTVSFSVTASGTGLTYQWRKSGVNIVGATSAIYTIPAPVAGDAGSYDIVVSGTCTPSVSSNVVTLTVSALPVITVQPTIQSTCEGISVSFSVAATGTSLAYQWRKSGVNITGATSATYTIVSPIPADAGSYDVVVSGTCTPAVTSNIVTLSVNSAPTISIEPVNSTICNGANTSYNVAVTGSALAYQWQMSIDGGTTFNNQADGGTYSGMTTTAMSIAGATIGMNSYQYRCVVSGACAPPATSNAATLTVNSLPAIIIQPVDQTTCEATSVSFSVMATGTGLTYQWRKGGINIAGATSATYTITSPVVGDAGSYDVVVSGTCTPAVTSNVVTLTVNAAPAITVQPNNSAICDGANTTFSVTVPGTALTYQWQLSIDGGSSWTNQSNGGVYSNTTTAAMSITGASASMNSYQYRCVVSSTCALPTTSNPALLTVNTLPAITVQPISQTTCAGTSVLLSVTATGTGLTYQWRKSGVNIAGATAAIYNITSPVAGDAGDYDVVISGTCAPSVTSNLVTLTVNALPAITVQPINQTICAGSSVTFSVTAAGAVLTYQWRKGGLNIAGAISNTYTITTSVTGDAGSYDVIIGGTCVPSVTSNTVTLIVNSPPAITTQPTSSAICDGANVTYSVVVSGMSLTYQWQLSTDGGATYTNQADGGEYSGMTTSSMSITGATVAMSSYQYRCAVNGTCAMPVTSNAAILTVNALPLITVQPVSQNTCDGSSISMNVSATGAGLTYQWRKGGMNVTGATSSVYTIALPLASDAGSYDVVVSGTCAPAVTSNVVTLTVSTAPVVTKQPSDTALCAGGNAAFSVTAPGTTLTYQWQLSADGGITYADQADGGVYSNMTTSAMSITGATADMNAYQYRCAVSGICSPPATSNAATLTIYSSPAITVQPVSKSTCEGTSVSFKVTATGTGLSYQWRKGGSNITGATSSTYTIASPLFGDAGSYDVVIRGTCMPAVTSNVVTLTINSLPVITAQPINQTSCEFDTVSFSVTATGIGLSYQWRKEGVNIAGATAATYTIAAPVIADAGNYDVVVRKGACVSATTSNSAVLSIEASPKVISIKTDSVCLPGGNVLLSAKASVGVINWYDSAVGGTLLGTTMSEIDWNTPSISATTIYYAEATDNGCHSMTRRAVAARVTKCNDTIPVILCNTDGDYDLFTAKAFYTDTNGTWVDTTGLLFSKSLVNVTNLNGTYLFSYLSMNNTHVLLTVNPYKRSGTSLNLPMLCENTINLFSTLTPGTFETGGIWYRRNPDAELPDSIVDAPVGTSSYYYKQNVNGGCFVDSTVVTISVDSIRPEITCQPNITKGAIYGTSYYEVQGSELNPVVTDTCGISALINDYNNDTTLYGQRFNIGSYTITWKAVDMAGNENTCKSLLTIDKFSMLNFFSPNNDGINDFWNFDLGSDHPEAYVEVFNRWGEMVWKSDKGYHNKWNGIDKRGKEIPDGGYQYLIIENEKVISAGSVTILR